MKITIVGIDLAKNVFQVHGWSCSSGVVLPEPAELIRDYCGHHLTAVALVSICWNLAPAPSTP